jgi:hypothetical protein
MPLLFKFANSRRLLVRTGSQTALNYRASSLSEGRAGAVHGGDRLPWVQLSLNGAADNYAPLASLSWQLHVYGESTPEIRTLCAERRLPLHDFAWSPNLGRAGLRRNAAYLVRPDGYIALVNGEGRASAIASYLDARNLLAP